MKGKSSRSSLKSSFQLVVCDLNIVVPINFSSLTEEPEHLLNVKTIVQISFIRVIEAGEIQFWRVDKIIDTIWKIMNLLGVIVLANIPFSKADCETGNVFGRGKLVV